MIKFNRKEYNRWYYLKHRRQLKALSRIRYLDRMNPKPKNEPLTISEGAYNMKMKVLNPDEDKNYPGAEKTRAKARFELSKMVVVKSDFNSIYTNDTKTTLKDKEIEKIVNPLTN